MSASRPLQGRSIFLSASLPDICRALPDFIEIPRAVSAFANALLVAGARLVFGGHPSISRIVLRASEDVRLPGSGRAQTRHRIKLYQSEFFAKNMVSSATRDLIDRGLSELVWVPLAGGESVLPARARRKPGDGQASLTAMRKRMVNEKEVAAAVFVGGADGVEEEFRMFRNYWPGRPVFLLGGAPGMARELSSFGDGEAARDFRHSTDFPRLARTMIDHLARS